MLSSFGWSASCLLEAIKLVDKVRKALKEAGGAASQYSDAVSFLESLGATFEHLKSSIENLDGHPYVECAGQGKRDCSISSVLSGLIELSELEVGVKV